MIGSCWRWLESWPGVDQRLVAGVESVAGSFYQGAVVLHAIKCMQNKMADTAHNRKLLQVRPCPFVRAGNQAKQDHPSAIDDLVYK